MFDEQELFRSDLNEIESSEFEEEFEFQDEYEDEYEIEEEYEVDDENFKETEMEQCSMK